MHYSGELWDAGFLDSIMRWVYEFDELQDLASLGSAAIESKYTWVLQVARPNIIGFSCVLSPSTHESGELLDPASLGTIVCWA